MLKSINQQAFGWFNSTKHECCLWWHAPAKESGIGVVSPSPKTWWLDASESTRAH